MKEKRGCDRWLLLLVAIVGLFLGAMLLSGCSTAAGFGRDIDSAFTGYSIHNGQRMQAENAYQDGLNGKSYQK